MNCSVNGFVELPNHLLAVGPALMLHTWRLMGVDVRVDFRSEEGSVKIEVKVNPTSSNGDYGDELD